MHQGGHICFWNISCFLSYVFCFSRWTEPTVWQLLVLPLHTISNRLQVWREQQWNQVQPFLSPSLLNIDFYLIRFCSEERVNSVAHGSLAFVYYMCALETRQKDKCMLKNYVKILLQYLIYQLLPVYELLICTYIVAV